MVQTRVKRRGKKAETVTPLRAAQINKEDNENVDQEEPAFRCSKCSSAFRHKGNLTRHLRDGFCTGTFRRPKGARRPKIVRKANEPLGENQCEKCFGNFSNSGNLNRHQRDGYCTGEPKSLRGPGAVTKFRTVVGKSRSARVIIKRAMATKRKRVVKSVSLAVSPETTFADTTTTTVEQPPASQQVTLSPEQSLASDSDLKKEEERVKCDKCLKSYSCQGSLRRHVHGGFCKGPRPAVKTQKKRQPRDIKKKSSTAGAKSSKKRKVVAINDPPPPPESEEKAVHHRKVYHEIVTETLENGDTIYVCSTCSKGYANRGNATRHFKIVHAKGAYKCTICGITLSTYKELWKHRRDNHELTLHQCPHCPKKYTEYCNMVRHRKLVHGESTGNGIVPKKRLRKPAVVMPRPPKKRQGPETKEVPVAGAMAVQKTLPLPTYSFQPPEQRYPMPTRDDNGDLDFRNMMKWGSDVEKYLSRCHSLETTPMSSFFLHTNRHNPNEK